MAQSGGGGGGIAAALGKLSSSGAGDGALEDRLSALPDDVLVLILLRLCTTAEAARTSVLSRRWPRVWHLLPELHFEIVPDGHRIRERVKRSKALKIKTRQSLSSRVLLKDIGDYQYSMEDITMLPPTTFLKMGVKHEGHDFGPSTFHLLRRCTGIRRLQLVLHGGGLEYSACQSGCNCDQPTDWKAEELSLNCLEKVELTDLKGADHEVVFEERLFSWATVLKKIRVTFHYSVSKSKARELLQTLSSFSRSETLVEFYMYHDNKVSTYLLAPEAKELSLISRKRLYRT